MKQYIAPAAEELQETLAATLLEGSTDAEREGYGEGSQFDW